MEQVTVLNEPNGKQEEPRQNETELALLHMVDHHLKEQTHAVRAVGTAMDAMGEKFENGLRYQTKVFGGLILVVILALVALAGKQMHLEYGGVEISTSQDAFTAGE